MMFRNALTTALFFIVGISSVVNAQNRSTVKFVQGALIELGYDPGPVDGAWGGKSRRALNEYRATFGLPDQRNLAGSSLYLLHRKAPGDQTLPNPGLVAVDFKIRQSFLKENREIGLRHCNNRLNLPLVSDEWGAVGSFTENRSSKTSGFVSDADDWYSEFSEGLVVTNGLCLSGQTWHCEKTINFVNKWVRNDALTTPVSRNKSEAYDGVAWIANQILQPAIMTVAQEIALNDPEIVDIAPTLDWLYDRVNRFHHVRTRNAGKYPNRLNQKASNHSVSAVLPSIMLGALLGDRELFDRAKPVYTEALSNMRSDGSFPTETQRGSRALHYMGLQLSYLLALAQVAESQGGNFYALKGKSGQDIHDAVSFTIKGWGDWDGIVKPYATKNVGAPKTPRSPMATYIEGNFGWLVLYQSAYPDHPNQALIPTQKLDPVICSEVHQSEGRSDNWWCRSAGAKELTIQDILLDRSKKISIMNHAMGFNAACLFAESSDLFPNN